MSWAVCRPVLWSFIIILIVYPILPTNNGKASAEPSTLELTVASTDIEGNDLIGKYVELRQNGTFVMSGFTPVAFLITNATEYQVGVADFRHHLFDHWLDTGSTDRWRSVTISEDIRLVAVYRIDADTVTQTAGGGSGGGSRNKAVIIISPEDGELVSPAGIGVSGVTIGNPTSVEIAVRNPTYISTPYMVVIPRSPDDFTWWSYSLVVNDLTMTQIDVRALFSDGSQQSDSVHIFYYTGSGSSSSGSSTNANILDSIHIVDLNTNLTSQIETITLTDTPDSSDVPNDVNTVDNQSPPQTSFAIIFPLLLALAVAAFLAWLILRKRQVLSRQFKKLS